MTIEISALSPTIAISTVVTVVMITLVDAWFRQVSIMTLDPSQKCLYTKCQLLIKKSFNNSRHFCFYKIMKVWFRQTEAHVSEFCFLKLPTMHHYKDFMGSTKMPPTCKLCRQVYFSFFQTTYSLWWGKQCLV